MKLLDNINTKISDKKYIDMMQIVQRCKDDDRFIKSDESLSSPEIFYKKVSDEIVGKNNNQNISYPIVDLFSTLLFGKKLQISTGGPF
ncbi:hypothetical protein KA037_04330 [Patescibacteria group bacterium]|nr:hypothetical protein [Patescibacteria group bacterium]